jgi:hypothetical protein
VNADVVVRDLSCVSVEPTDRGGAVLMHWCGCTKQKRSRPLVQFVTSMPAVLEPLWWAKGDLNPSLTRRNSGLPAVSLRLVPIQYRSVPAVSFSSLDGVKTAFALHIAFS